MEIIEHELVVPSHMAQMRLDKALSELLPQYSRAKLVEWLKGGEIRVDGHQLLPKFKLSGDEQIVVKAEVSIQTPDLPEPMALDIVFEDEHLLILNKPAGKVVHPAAGNHQGTLLNGLLNHCPSLSSLPRAGIVHRLDKDTTGLMVVAKTLEAHNGLVQMLQERHINRRYLALVQGAIIAGGCIETQMGRHPNNRIKMAVVSSGKEAVTHYRVWKRYTGHTLVEVKLETGRTHQIRVHMQHIRYPIIGCPLYSGRAKLPKGCDDNLRHQLSRFSRQALHAYKLSFTHPITKEPIAAEAAMPHDMQALVDALGAPEFCAQID